MAFWIYLIVMVVLTLIADLTRPVPKSPKRPGIGDFEFPTVDASRKVPVIWGKPLLRGPNLTWWGDLKITKIKKKIKGVFTDKEYVAGYKYNIGMHMAFCCASGIGSTTVRLLKILVNNEEVWTGNLESGRGEIKKPELFGGEEGEGGITGEFDWCPGGLGQMQNDYLATVRGDLPGPKVPAYRSSARLVWRRGYLGNSKYIKEWAAQCQRLPAMLGTGYHDINGEANPAEMLYEILMEKTWGLGVSILDVDITSFLRAAQVLHSENFGLSLVWDGSKTLRSISDDVLQHIDGVMFVNVLTGKWELQLNRAKTEAELADLITLDDDCIKELESYSRPSMDETTNEVNVIWTEGGNTTLWPAKAQDLGLFQVHDKQFISVDTTYQGVTSYELAQRLATRDLAVLGYPLLKVGFKANRKAKGLKPGSRFKFSWKPLGVESVVCVVLGIDYGTLDDNLISIEAVQDVFSLGAGLYNNGGQSGWIPPSRTPLAPTRYRMEFSPYWFLKIAENVPSPEAAVPMVMVEAPNEGHLSYDMEYSDPSMNGAFAEAPGGDLFTPTAELVYDYLETSPTDTSGTLVLRNLTVLDTIPSYTTQDVRHLGNGLVLIDNEWMAITSATARADGTWVCNTVFRGLLDGPPVRHLAGTKVWFVGEGVARTPTQLVPFAAGVYRARVMTRALGGLLERENAVNLSITTNATSQNARPLYPYPVRNLHMTTGAGYSWTPTGVLPGSLFFYWKQRNRAAEDYVYFQDDTPTVTPEVDQTYAVRMYNHDGALRSEVITGASVESVAFSAAVIPQAGYVQVETRRTGVGSGQRTTLWFGQLVDYALTVDGAPQRLIAETSPWAFWRLSD